MKNTYRSLLAAALSASILCTFTGCSSTKNKEQQIQYRQYGISCMSNGDYEGAVKAFQNALDQSVGGIGETEVDICLYKAKAQYLSGDFEGAKETYKGLVEYKPYPEAYYQRGCFYFAIGDAENGIKDFERAIELNPDNADIYIGVYENIRKTGYGEAPEEYLRKALAIEGEGLADNVDRGRIYLLLKEEDKAIDELEKALEKGEKKANFFLAMAYAAKGDEDKSEKYFEEYKKSGIASAAELCSMADAHISKNEYKTALKYLQAALEMNDVVDPKSIRKSIIICYENIGDFESAKANMESYVADYPDDTDAKRDFTFLKTR